MQTSRTEKIGFKRGEAEDIFGLTEGMTTEELDIVNVMLYIKD